jgi:hypothetical protein
MGKSHHLHPANTGIIANSPQITTAMETPPSEAAVVVASCLEKQTVPLEEERYATPPSTIPFSPLYNSIQWKPRKPQNPH